MRRGGVPDARRAAGATHASPLWGRKRKDRDMSQHTRTFAAVVSAGLAVAAGGLWAGDLVFEEATDTNLPEIMAAWKKEREDLQEKAHPGKRDSHWWWLTALSAGDFDGDGDADIVFAHHGSPGTRIFTNQLKEKGKLTFLDLTGERTLSGSFEPMIADGSTYVFDYDGDGTPDVMSMSDESKAWAALNDGKGRFRAQESPFRIAQAYLGDINGDGLIDVISPFDGGNPFVNRGKGKYERCAVEKPVIGPGGWTYCAMPADCKFPDELRELAAGKTRWPICLEADLDGDGRPETLVNLGVAYQAQGFCLFRKTPGGYEDITRAAGLPYKGRVSSVYDFNGDGAPDLLLTASSASGVYLNDGKGKFIRVEDGLARSLSTSPAPATTLDTLADFDEDGRPEMIVLTFRSGAQSGLYRSEGGKFEPTALRLSGSWQFAVCDVDGDDRLDIVAGTDRGPVIYLNKTAPAGHFINVKLKGPPTNPLGLDAVVEAWASGGAGNPKKLITRVRNNTEGISAALSVCGIGHSAGGGLPVHLGLGSAAAVDLRVTFPGGKVVELKNVDVKKNPLVTADGKLEDKP